MYGGEDGRMPYVWILIAIVGLLIDIFTSNFFFICFSIGSIMAIISSFLGANIPMQIIVFGVISIAAIALLYPVVKKLLKNTVVRTPRMEEKYIGRNFIAVEDIDSEGMIKIDGIYWTVRNYGERINKGDKFILTSLEGTKFIIEKIKGE